MGFSLFGNKDSTDSDRSIWEGLRSMDALETLLKNSEARPQVIFKHSTRCGISRHVLRNFENDWDSKESTEVYLLDLLAYREISNAIESRFGVVHQSPQVVVLYEGKPIFHASHQSIDAHEIGQHIKAMVNGSR
ncbi:MAG: bacillithiol system redox-active protein YtxJ [Flavobacteriales bacterium]|nr:bacillithiol system redox-active protein YtxJ [Flavobacteriales bacterium]